MLTEPFSTTWKQKRDLPLWKKMRSTGVLGMVIAIPTALGMAMGIWVDTLWPGSHSWFSILTPVGLGLGCFCAVFWSYTGQKDA